MSSSAPVLPEYVVRLVIDVVDDRPTLASIARVSRALSGQALDRLWSRLDNLYALAKCMPAPLWEEYETTQRDAQYQSRNHAIRVRHPDVIDPDMLGDRFFANALRVRELVLGFSPSIRLEDGRRVRVDVDKSVLALWIRCSAHGDLFPRLHSATVYSHVPYDPLLMQLIPESRRPQLRSLSVMTGNVSTNLVQGDVLSRIIDTFPGLRRLDIRHPTNTLQTGLFTLQLCWPSPPAPSVARTKAVTPSTLRFANLSELSTLLMIPADALRHIAEIPSLESLNCALKPNEDFSSFPPNGFAALKDLALNSGDVVPLLSFLKTVSSTQLQVVDVTMDSDETTEPVNRIKALFTTLCFHPSRTSLREIHVRGTLIRWGRWKSEERTLDKLAEPLFGMPQLRVLSLPQLNARLDDAGYSRLADALPRLTHFKVLHPPLFSLSTIRAVADKASPEAPPPLGLRLEDTWALYEKEADLSPLSANVYSLCLTDISSGNVQVQATLARNLLDLFPNLDNVVLNTGARNGDHELDHFESLNKALKMARQGSTREDVSKAKTYALYSPIYRFSHILHRFTDSRTRISNTGSTKGARGRLFL